MYDEGPSNGAYTRDLDLDEGLEWGLLLAPTKQAIFCMLFVCLCSCPFVLDPWMPLEADFCVDAPVTLDL